MKTKKLYRVSSNVSGIPSRTFLAANKSIAKQMYIGAVEAWYEYGVIDTIDYGKLTIIELKD